ncbi:MAG: beta-lactamase family protein [Planctomycetes bacterium]|nr:beta-lactamase family protein [Planctomycetota bacterium]
MNSSASCRVGMLPALALFLGCAARPEVAPAPAIELDAIRGLANRAVTDGGIVGLAIGIAVDGRTVFAEGFGFADLERRRSVTAKTIFDVGSVGKQFTAAAILRLADRGELSLDDRVRKHVPATPANFPDATLADLLHHTSGFVDGDFDELHPPAALARPQHGLELLANTALQGGRAALPPRSNWTYSNSGYVLLGLVVESVSGRSYADFVAAELLEPLGVDSITVGVRPTGERSADSLRRVGDDVVRVPSIDMSVYGGAGSVCSDVVGLLAWEHALDGGRVLSPASWHACRTPGELVGRSAATASPYGMAQRLGSLHGWRKVGHTGSYAGGSAVLSHYPELGLTIAIATNTRGGDTPHALRLETEIAELVLAGCGPTAAPSALPIPPEVRVAIEGTYSNGRTRSNAHIVDDHLVVREGDREVGRFAYAGGLAFFDPARPLRREWFELDGPRAGWWVYARDGFPMGCLRRVEP